MNPSCVRTDGIGDNPQRAVRYLVPELCDREACDVPRCAHPKHGLVTKPQTVSRPTSGAESRSRDIPCTIVVGDLTRQLLSPSSAAPQADEVVGIFEVTDPNQFAHVQHKTYFPQLRI